jgi:hypothetical protein
MKTGPEALGTAENEYENAKHENGTDTLEPPKMSPRAKHENGTRRPPHRRKLSESVKHENGTDAVENDFG